MAKKQTLLSIIIFIVLSNALWAQALVFHHLRFRDGLPSNTVNCVYQDQTGFMWFGTDKGLCRYDGYSFINYYPDDYQEIFNVLTIYQSKDDTRYLWIGTDDSVYRYDIIKDTFLKIKMEKDLKQKINDICGAKKNDIWIAARKGVFRIDSLNADSSIYYSLSHRPMQGRPNATCLLADSKNNIWAGAGLDLYRYVKGKDTFRHVITLKNQSLRNNAWIAQIKEDRQGVLWLATYGEGLFRYDPSSGALHNYKVSNNIPVKGRINFQRSLLFDTMDTLWIATYGSGLARFNKTTHKFDFYIKSSDDPYSISDNDLTSLYQDSQGLIWVGTLNTGVERFNRSITEIRNRTLPGKKSATVFCEDHTGLLWIGTSGNILYRYDIKKNHLELVQTNIQTSKFYITGIVEDPSQKFLWVSTLHKGLHRFDLKSLQFQRVRFSAFPSKSKRSNGIFTLFKDSHGDIWLGTFSKGIWRFNNQIKRFRRYLTKWRVGTSFFEDKAGRIWVGAKGALAVYDIEQGVFREFVLPEFAKGLGTVYSLLQTADSTMWIGTSKGLLSYKGKLGTSLHFQRYPAFNGYQIKEIIEDKKHTLWLSTDQGILNFNPLLNYIVKYGHEEGVWDLNFNWHSGIRTHDGTIFLGNNSGFVIFRPLQNMDLQISNIFITNFQYINTSQLTLPTTNPKLPVVRPDTIYLDWAHYTFFIEFSMNDYLVPGRNRFAYQLKGLDNDWHDLGNHHVLNFINLPPHTYTLRIKGANSAGIWNESGTSLTFVIAAPFWQKWWFRISAALFIIALIWLAFIVRTYSIRRRNRELEELNKKLNKQIVYREQVEKMLRESERKYRTLVEGIGEGIFVINKVGVFSFLNKTAAERIGGKPGDFVGKSLTQIFSEQEAQFYLKETAEVIAKRKAKLINTAIKLNGQLRHFRISLQPVANINGEVDQVLSIAIETTEQVTLEEQLRQAQKMEAIGKLAGGVAHDFNNLLSIIRGYTYLLLQEHHIDDPSFESLQEIEKASERAQSLTGQLLAFSRKQILEPKVMDLNHYIREMEKMLHRLIGEQIQLSTKLSNDLPPIFADSGQIEQILMNLSVNARDAMPDGGKLYIETEMIRPEQHPSIIPAEKNQTEFVVLSVRDTGIGMDADVRDKIFDPFFTTKPQGKGTGLGLSTVFGIVKQTEGYIWVNSAPGKGSEFKIYFPAVNESPQKEEKGRESKQDLRGSEHILLVEDEGGLQIMLGKMLRLYGYKVTTAGSGTEGIERFSANPEEYQMIITDVVMPDISGIEMVARLNDQFGDIPVLYMSGYTDDEVIRHGIVERGIRFIQKPFTPNKITQKIRQILDGKN